MSSVNKVILVGNAGKDAVSRSLGGGREMASFSMATSKTWKKDGERQERTSWHNVVVFTGDDNVKVAKRIRKGQRVYVEGSMQTRKWQDNKGQDRWSTDVVLDEFSHRIEIIEEMPVKFIGEHRGPSGPEDYGPTRTRERGTTQDNDEVPF